MIQTDLWPEIRALLRNVERPSRYVGDEWGAQRKDNADFSFCMIYPDTYELGQPNQAVRILTNAVAAHDGIAAERAFLPAPDMADAMRASGVPLFSLESCTPVGEFDVVGITLPHELAATNVLEALDLAGIPLHAADRGEDCPIVIAGGPCALNPEPYAMFFDAFSIGEGEEAVPEIVETVRRLRAAGASRADILHELAHIESTYVPAFYEPLDQDAARRAGTSLRALSDDVPTIIEKRVFEGFAESSGWEPCIVPYMEAVHDRLNVEVLRGCARGCRFCQAGMMYRPVRERSADAIVDAVLRGLEETGYDEVSLTSLSTTDHSQIAEILERLNEACAGKGIRVSVPSQRLDSFGVQMAGLVAGQKKGGLTFAPEAGTQRLRDIINKNVTEADLMSALDAAMEAGWRRCKLYFMVGLPGETDDDVRGIAHLADAAYERMKAAVPPDARGGLSVTVSIALFVPKAQTPFQWDGQIAPDEARRRVALVKEAVRNRAVRVTYHDPETSFIEAVMSRGGRECAHLVEAAWQEGARFDAWTELFNEMAWKKAIENTGIDPAALAQATYDDDHVLPWAHISCGVSQEFLRDERARARAGKTTGDCTYDTCTACGVCPSLHTKNKLAAPRVHMSEPREHEVVQ